MSPKGSPEYPGTEGLEERKDQMPPEELEEYGITLRRTDGPGNKEYPDVVHDRGWNFYEVSWENLPTGASFNDLVQVLASIGRRNPKINTISARIITLED